MQRGYMPDDAKPMIDQPHELEPDEFEPRRRTPHERETLLALADELASLSGDAFAEIDRFELLERLFGAAVCRRLGIYRLPADFVLSVVIPVYNEARTVRRVVESVCEAVAQCEMIVVDDGSSDETPQALDRLADDFARGAHGESARLKIVRHERNRGKGAALHTGLAHVTGDVVAFQDADLEYDPRDLPALLLPILENEADVVYGSRFAGGERRVTSLWHRWANGLITLLSNLKTGLALSDVETCYKLIRREQLERLPPLRERGFGIELEITARLARLGARLVERPIRYLPRGYDEGKKIGWRDALRALWCVLRY